MGGPKTEMIQLRQNHGEGDVAGDGRGKTRGEFPFAVRIGGKYICIKEKQNNSVVVEGPSWRRLWLGEKYVTRFWLVN